MSRRGSAATAVLLTVAGWGLAACSHENDPDAGECASARGDTAKAALLDAAPRAQVTRTDPLAPGAVMLQVRGQDQPYVVTRDDDGWGVFSGPGCGSVTCADLTAALTRADAVSHEVPDPSLAYAATVSCAD
ncbi:hypothetical protein [Nocardioides sp. LML1-1-1.1]|uniref:hypothetical protein n=1 Tax=Nocardioides sp. LML1-1-1.1 TaxID=3135248 RepID=UPI003435C5AF